MTANSHSAANMITYHISLLIALHTALRSSLTPVVCQVSTISPGDIVTVQGESVSRYFIVVSGSIGTLNHAAVEHWHNKIHGPLAAMDALQYDAQDAAAKSEAPQALIDTLAELDRHPMNFPKHIHKKEIMQRLAARIMHHARLVDGNPPPPSYVSLPLRNTPFVSVDLMHLTGTGPVFSGWSESMMWPFVTACGGAEEL